MFNLVFYSRAALARAASARAASKREVNSTWVKEAKKLRLVSGF
jgi:hypothetical protein